MAQILNMKPMERVQYRFSLPWKIIIVTAVIVVVTVAVGMWWQDSTTEPDPYENIDPDAARTVMDAIIDAQEAFKTGPVSGQNAVELGWTPGFYAAGIDDLVRAGVLEEIPVDTTTETIKKIVKKIDRENMPGIKREIYIERPVTKKISVITPEIVQKASAVENARKTVYPKFSIAGYYFKILTRYINSRGGIVDLEEVYYQNPDNPKETECRLKGGYALIAYPRRYKNPETTPVFQYLVAVEEDEGRYEWEVNLDPVHYDYRELHKWTIAHWLGERRETENVAEEPEQRESRRGRSGTAPKPARRVMKPARSQEPAPPTEPLNLPPLIK